MNPGTFAGQPRPTSQVRAVRLSPRRPARTCASTLLALVLAVTGCASHHSSRSSSSAAASAADTAQLASGSAPTSCEEGDTGCSCVTADVTDYDSACNVATDCVAITAGTMCGSSSCFAANAAVNVDSYKVWDTDRQPVEYESCVPATPGTVACVSHACVIQYPDGSSSDSSADGGSNGGGGGEGASGGGGADNGVEIDIPGDDDDDTGTTVTTGDDDSSGTSGDDDDDDDASTEGKHRPHAHAKTGPHSAAVSDVLK